MPAHWVVGTKDSHTGEVKYVYFTRDKHGKQYTLTGDNFLHTASRSEDEALDRIADVVKQHPEYKIRKTKYDKKALANLGHLVLGQSTQPQIKLGTSIDVSELPNLTAKTCPFTYPYTSRAQYVLRTSSLPSGVVAVSGARTSPQLFLYSNLRTVPATPNNISQCFVPDKLNELKYDKVYSSETAGGERNDTYWACVGDCKIAHVLTIVEHEGVTNKEMVREHNDNVRVIQAAHECEPRCIPFVEHMWSCTPQSEGGTGYGYFLAQAENTKPYSESGYAPRASRPCKGAPELKAEIKSLVGRLNDKNVYVGLYGQELNLNDFLFVQQPSGKCEVLLWNPQKMSLKTGDGNYIGFASKVAEGSEPESRGSVPVGSGGGGATSRALKLDQTDAIERQKASLDKLYEDLDSDESSVY